MPKKSFGSSVEENRVPSFPVGTSVKEALRILGEAEETGFKESDGAVLSDLYTEVELLQI
jgi:hypothetical protein